MGPSPDGPATAVIQTVDDALLETKRRKVEQNAEDLPLRVQKLDCGGKNLPHNPASQS
jgi:hypothetical protein